MIPLNIDVSQFGTSASNSDNIKDALKRGLPEITPAFCAHDGTFVIVGSGCSLPDYIEDIKKESGPIVAIKGSHDLLIENDITPDLFVSVEPRDRRENLKHKNKKTVYLLASRVNPLVFDHLSDCNVVLWHSWSNEKECEAFKGHMAIGGGTTSGLRAINIGYVLGFRKFILYGFDSCLSDDKERKRFTGEGPGQIIDVIVGGKTFYCTYALAQQAQDFQQLYKIMDITVESKGNGLISEIIKERKRLGMKA